MMTLPSGVTVCVASVLWIDSGFLPMLNITITGGVLTLPLLSLLSLFPIALLCDMGKGPSQAFQHKFSTGPLLWHRDVRGEVDRLAVVFRVEN